MGRAQSAGSRPGEERSRGRESPSQEPGLAGAQRNPGKFTACGHTWVQTLRPARSGKGAGALVAAITLSPPGTGRCTSTGPRTRTSWSCGKGTGWTSCSGVTMAGLWVRVPGWCAGGGLRGDVLGSRRGFACTAAVCQAGSAQIHGLTPPVPCPTPYYQPGPGCFPGASTSVVAFVP